MQLGATDGGSFRFGPFRLDRDSRVVWRGDSLVPLGPRSVDLLVVLADRVGEVVTKDELMSRVWPDTFVEEANLSVHVSALRKALRATVADPPYIQTVHRRGYRLLPAPSEPETRPTLAVLPFRDISASASDEHLGVGTTVALIGRLSRLSGLVVRSTGAVLRYLGSDVDPQTAARELHVRAVVEGTIQRSGSRVRVTVNLVSAEAGVTWSDTFDAAFGNLFAAQDEAAAHLARVLEVELGGRDRAVLARRDTSDVQAYQAYLKGRFFWSRFTASWMEKAFFCFQEAADRDPGYAMPHAGLADAYVILGFTGQLAPRDAWERAEAAALRALQLDDALADPHVSLAFVRLFRDWDWAAAEEGLALALSRSSAAAVHQWYGLLLDIRGRFGEARRHVSAACMLEPLSVVARALEGFQSYLAAEHDAELRQWQAITELDPNHFVGHWGLGLALIAQGRLDEARAAHERTLVLAEGQMMMKPVLARTLALCGDRVAARALLDEGGDDTMSLYQRATVDLALGEPAAALDCLEHAAERREPWMVWLPIDPMFDGLRSHPRCVALVKAVAGEAPPLDADEAD